MTRTAAQKARKRAAAKSAAQLALAEQNDPGGTPPQGATVTATVETPGSQQQQVPSTPQPGPDTAPAGPNQQPASSAPQCSPTTTPAGSPGTANSPGGYRAAFSSLKDKLIKEWKDSVDLSEHMEATREHVQTMYEEVLTHVVKTTKSSNFDKVDVKYAVAKAKQQLVEKWKTILYKSTAADDYDAERAKLLRNVAAHVSLDSKFLKETCAPGTEAGTASQQEAPPPPPQETSSSDEEVEQTTNLGYWPNNQGPPAAVQGPSTQQGTIPSSTPQLNTVASATAQPQAVETLLPPLQVPNQPQAVETLLPPLQVPSVVVQPTVPAVQQVEPPELQQPPEQQQQEGSAVETSVLPSSAAQAATVMMSSTGLYSEYPASMYGAPVPMSGVQSIPGTTAGPPMQQIGGPPGLAALPAPQPTVPSQANSTMQQQQFQQIPMQQQQQFPAIQYFAAPDGTMVARPVQQPMMQAGGYGTGMFSNQDWWKKEMDMKFQEQEKRMQQQHGLMVKMAEKFTKDRNAIGQGFQNAQSESISTRGMLGETRADTDAALERGSKRIQEGFGAMDAALERGSKKIQENFTAVEQQLFRNQDQQQEQQQQMEKQNEEMDKMKKSLAEMADQQEKAKEQQRKEIQNTIAELEKKHKEELKKVNERRQESSEVENSSPTVLTAYPNGKLRGMGLWKTLQDDKSKASSKQQSKDVTPSEGGEYQEVRRRGHRKSEKQGLYRDYQNDSDDYGDYHRRGGRGGGGGGGEDRMTSALARKKRQAEWRPNALMDMMKAINIGAVIPQFDEVRFQTDQYEEDYLPEDISRYVGKENHAKFTLPSQCKTITDWMKDLELYVGAEVNPGYLCGVLQERSLVSRMLEAMPYLRTHYVIEDDITTYTMTRVIWSVVAENVMISLPELNAADALDDFVPEIGVDIVGELERLKRVCNRVGFDTAESTIWSSRYISRRIGLPEEFKKILNLKKPGIRTHSLDQMLAEARAIQAQRKVQGEGTLKTAKPLLKHPTVKVNGVECCALMVQAHDSEVYAADELEVYALQAQTAAAWQKGGSHDKDQSGGSKQIPFWLRSKRRYNCNGYGHFARDCKLQGKINKNEVLYTALRQWVKKRNARTRNKGKGKDGKFRKQGKGNFRFRNQGPRRNYFVTAHDESGKIETFFVGNDEDFSSNCPEASDPQSDGYELQFESESEEEEQEYQEEANAVGDNKQANDNAETEKSSKGKEVAAAQGTKKEKAKVKVNAAELEQGRIPDANFVSAQTEMEEADSFLTQGGDVFYVGENKDGAAEELFLLEDAVKYEEDIPVQRISNRAISQEQAGKVLQTWKKLKLKTGEEVTDDVFAILETATGNEVDSESGTVAGDIRIKIAGDKIVEVALAKNAPTNEKDKYERVIDLQVDKDGTKEESKQMTKSESIPDQSQWKEGREGEWQKSTNFCNWVTLLNQKKSQGPVIISDTGYNRYLYLNGATAQAIKRQCAILGINLEFCSERSVLSTAGSPVTSVGSFPELPVVLTDKQGRSKAAGLFWSHCGKGTQFARRVGAPETRNQWSTETG